MTDDTAVLAHDLDLLSAGRLPSVGLVLAKLGDGVELLVAVENAPGPAGPEPAVVMVLHTLFPTGEAIDPPFPVRDPTGLALALAQAGLAAGRAAAPRAGRELRRRAGRREGHAPGGGDRPRRPLA